MHVAIVEDDPVIAKAVTGTPIASVEFHVQAANDLSMSLAVIRATPDDQSPLPGADRVRELRQFAVSEEYFRLRQRMGIAMVVAQKQA